jgi:hypothetical protein
MRNHRHLTNLTLQGERGRTIVGLLHCGGVVVPAMDLPDLVFKNSSGDTRAWNKVRLKGSSSIPKSLLEEMTARYGNWKPALSK